MERNEFVIPMCQLLRDRVNEILDKLDDMDNEQLEKVANYWDIIIFYDSDEPPIRDQIEDQLRTFVGELESWEEHYF